MKIPALLAATFLTFPCMAGAEDIFVPALTTDWASFDKLPPGAKVWQAMVDRSNEIPLPESMIEVAADSFYLFRSREDRKTGKISTRVYHSTKQDLAFLKEDYLEAMHLVAEFPVKVTYAFQSEKDWLLHTEGPKNESQSAKIEWRKITPPVPAAPGAGKLRVAIFDDNGSFGAGVPKCAAQLGKTTDIEVTKLNAAGIRAGLSGYHAVVFTGGSGSAQAAALGLAGREQVRRFVEAGGGYVGICAGAYLACDGFSWGVHVLDAKTPSNLWERGKAELQIEATDTARSRLHMPASASVLYHNGPILTPGGNPALPDYEPLVFFRSEVSKTPKHAGLQINSPAIVLGSCGKGKVLVSSPHPEQSAGMERWIEDAVRAVIAEPPAPNTAAAPKKEEPAKKAEPEWRALPLITDGKVNADWVHVGWGGFVVDDGALRTDCAPKGLGLLVYKKEKIGNCQVRVVYRSKEPKSNSGVYIRVADGILDQVEKPGAVFERDAAGKISKESAELMKGSSERDEGPWYAVHHGYEVQIADAADIMHRTGALYSLAPSTFAPKDTGVWRTMIITLTGKKVSVEIDGVPVSSFDPATAKLPERKQWYEPKREPERPEAGYFGLQNHDPGDVVWFKEVSVRPLPANAAK